MSVSESHLPPKMLACARAMYEAFAKNLAERGGPGMILSWDQLGQGTRDDWCAASVAAFQFVAYSSTQNKEQ